VAGMMHAMIFDDDSRFSGIIDAGAGMGETHI
jgi:hypothetical protein